MLSKLKDLRIILAVVLVLSWVIAGVLFFTMKSNMSTQLASKEEEIANLELAITDVGELVSAYIVIDDVPSGKQIEESDLELIDVPISMSTNLVGDSAELIGKYFKLGLTAGTVITSDCIYEEIITPDMRYYDLIVDVVPIGLKPGAFVDIRIKMGSGADFVGVTHRQVAAVYGNSIKLILTEEDIHMFSSMLVDNIVYGSDMKANFDTNGDGKINDSDTIKPIGSYIYAVEYVEGALQDKAAEYYAPSALIQGIMMGDPNIFNKDDLNANDMLLKRQFMEAGLVDVQQIAGTISEYVSGLIEEGRKVYDKMLEETMIAQREAEEAS